MADQNNAGTQDQQAAGGSGAATAQGTSGAAAGQGEQQRDWQADYEKLLEQSRKWEARSKANADKAKAYDEMRAKSMTDAERADEAAKRADAAEARLAEYERAEKTARLVAEVAAEKGVDAELLGRMSGDVRSEVEANADFIASRLSGSSIYPSVPDGGRSNAQQVTREQIEAIKDPRERVRMRAKHIELYR